MIRIIDTIYEDDDARKEIAKEGCKLATKEFSYRNIVQQICNLKH